MAKTIREQEAQYRRELAEGPLVWCDWVDRYRPYRATQTRTADGFCEHCGSTDHAPVLPGKLICQRFGTAGSYELRKTDYPAGHGGNYQIYLNGVHVAARETGEQAFAYLREAGVRL